MKTAEEILDTAIPNYKNGYKVGPSHKEDHIYNAILKAMEEYACIKAEQARREEYNRLKAHLHAIRRVVVVGMESQHYQFRRIGEIVNMALDGIGYGKEEM